MRCLKCFSLMAIIGRSDGRVMFECRTLSRVGVVCLAPARFREDDRDDSEKARRD